MSNEPEQRKSEFEEKIIKINRVSKKTKGGNKISFSALAVVGDKKGQVGVGFGKAPDTISAIQKSIRLGKRNIFKVSLKGNTTCLEHNPPPTFQTHMSVLCGLERTS